MELTKSDTQKAKGIAILGMLMLHLFCRLGDLPYSPLLWIGDIPLIYYLGLFGDFCAPIYCFCIGYAQYLQKETHCEEYGKVISKKLFRFLQNYWIIVVLFSGIGLLTGNTSSIPVSLPAFLGNVFLYRLSYNGAWWFVLTYLFLSVLSPFLIKITDKLNPWLLFFLSGSIYFVAYMFRFNISLEISNVFLAWVWQQLVLLGTSQFCYIIGTMCRKEKWVTKLRRFTRYGDTGRERIKWTVILMCTLVAAFLGHCVVKPLIVAPITAAMVLAWLFCTNMPAAVDRFLLLMGKHSTNIWLVHMFFYLTLFKEFVFIAKYPPFILTLMIAVCLFASWIIQGIDRGVRKNKEALGKIS